MSLKIGNFKNSKLTDNIIIYYYIIMEETQIITDKNNTFENFVNTFKLMRGFSENSETIKSTFAGNPNFESFESAIHKIQKEVASDGSL